MKARVGSNEEFARLLVGRTIVSAIAGKVEKPFREDDESEEDVEDMFISDPKFVLDDGTEITFDVDDHGSGTYEVWAEALVPRKTKRK